MKDECCAFDLESMLVERSGGKYSVTTTLPTFVTVVPKARAIASPALPLFEPCYSAVNQRTLVSLDPFIFKLVEVRYLFDFLESIRKTNRLGEYQSLGLVFVEPLCLNLLDR